MAAEPFPILFIAASRIGDAVLSSGLIRTLVDEAPNPRFTIVGSALTAPLFAHTPGLEALIIMEKRPLAGHWLDLWRKVRARHWSLIVDMRGSALSGLLRRDRRAVYRPSGSATHKVVEAARLLNLGDRPPAPFLYTSPRIEEAAARLTAGAGPILAIAPAANWVGKAWPGERFADIAGRLLSEGGRLMILGGPDDDVAAEPVRRAVPAARLIDLVGRCDLIVAYAALKRARLFIGADSGLMHLAAAAGVPTLGLFGPSDEALYAPWGTHGRPIRGPRAFADFRAIDPALNQLARHMDDLSADAVLSAAHRLLADTEETAAYG